MTDILVFDGSHAAYRVWHKMPPLSYRGVPTTVLFGFLKTMLKQYKKHKPKSIIVCWDGGTPNWRKELVPTYKESRKKVQRSPEEYAEFEKMKVQMEKLHWKLPMFGVSSLRILSTEADDLIARIPDMLEGDVTIVSGDQDMYQLVAYCTGVKVVDPIYNKELTRDNFHKTTGIIPDIAYWELYRAMVGDKSDNIPGIKGIGTKTALHILNELGMQDQEEDPFDVLVNHIRAQNFTPTVCNRLQDAIESDQLIDTIECMDLLEDVGATTPSIYQAFQEWTQGDYEECYAWMTKMGMMTLTRDDNLMAMVKTLQSPLEFSKVVEL